MAVKSEKELKKSSVIAIVWVAISLIAACFIGILGRGFLNETLVETGSENVFIKMIQQIFDGNIVLIFIGGLFLCGILAAIMSTADSQLLVCASSASKDIFKNILKPEAEDKKVLNVSRITVLVIAVVACIIAWNPDSSIMGLVSDAWAGLGSAFGPLVVCSLFWKRTTRAGAIAGMVAGGAMVFFWRGVLKPMGGVWGIYELLPAFLFSALVIVVVSLLTRKPSADMDSEFDRVKAGQV